ncbi:MAG: HAMP domain-containing sensor histidine kinase [Polyangia bacterium]
MEHISRPLVEPLTEVPEQPLWARTWFIGAALITLLALLVLLVFTDVHRRHADAMADFALEQEALASGLASGLGARLDALREDTLWAAERMQLSEPALARPGAPLHALQISEVDAPPVPSGLGEVALSFTLGGRKRANLSVPLSSLRVGFRELEQPGRLCALVLPPGASSFLTLSGRRVPVELFAGALKGTRGHVVLPGEIARQLRLPGRAAVVGLARLDAGELGIWWVAVAATARRALDREAQASWRSILAVLLSAGLVLILGAVLVVAQRRKLDAEKALALEAARRRREEELDRVSRVATLGALAMGIAHELSTPLGIISNRAEQILEFVNNPEMVGKSARVIGDQALRMSRVIRAILGLVRGESPADGVLSPAVIAQHAVDLVAHRFAAARVKLKLRADSDVPPIRGDQPLIEHAIVNLLLNACDACSAGGQVELSIRAEGGTAVFTVLDTGDGGVAEQAAPRAAAPSYTTGSRGDGFGLGFGLGLAIAQEILKGHRGALALKTGPQGGTCAEARLPLLPAPCPA